MRRAELAAAYAATIVWLGVGAILDVGLVRLRKRPITHVLRTPEGLVFLVVLNLHVAKMLGPLDPFSFVGRLLDPEDDD